MQILIADRDFRLIICHISKFLFADINAFRITRRNSDTSQKNGRRCRIMGTVAFFILFQEIRNCLLRPRCLARRKSVFGIIHDIISRLFNDLIKRSRTLLILLQQISLCCQICLIFFCDRRGIFRHFRKIFFYKFCHPVTFFLRFRPVFISGKIIMVRDQTIFQLAV